MRSILLDAGPQIALDFAQSKSDYVRGLLDKYAKCAYIHFMDFEWDERKRQSNISKHDVDFADAVAVFFDDFALTMNDPDHHPEQRFITIGMDVKARILVVAHAYPDANTIRIISARKADRQERREYEG